MGEAQPAESYEEITNSNANSPSVRSAWSPEGGNMAAMRQHHQQVVYSSLTPGTSLMDESPLRVLTSVVGSPFYVAPEVMQALLRANEGFARSYGTDDIMARVTAQIALRGTGLNKRRVRPTLNCEVRRCVKSREIDLFLNLG